MAITRLQLRRDAIKGLGDLRVLTATADGSDVTFYDSRNLNGEPGAYTDREVLFSIGTAANLGQIRTLTGSSMAQRAITWGVALPADTVTGDVCEMLNTRGIGYRFDDIHDAINQAIRGISDQALVPTSTDESSYVRGDGIVIPSDFVTIENVQWLSANDTTVWRSIPRANRINGNGWWVDPTTRTVVIGGRPSVDLNERTVKVWGLAAPSEMHDDSDETHLDPQWLIMQTQALLSRGRYMRMPTPETERLTYMFSQEAARLRAAALGRIGPFSVRL